MNQKLDMLMMVMQANRETATKKDKNLFSAQASMSEV
jgi:hypothetical protein